MERKGTGFAAFPMTAHRQGIAVKPMYYIEIHGVTARPDATFGGVFEPLIGFYAPLAGPCA
ncbi:hypothetical protein [Treponema endosymbiont of Eucomonympha sp.]|uniref:hypothetical protein n=1 Tax=Treponema endosymbiont of Eucomonympha sp. TaxID=1580831 RepID=UPI0016508C8D|nr:hypothetical protein [Treponema endosymbiont of Eucomonympha sp.]